MKVLLSTFLLSIFILLYISFLSFLLFLLHDYEPTIVTPLQDCHYGTPPWDNDETSIRPCFKMAAMRCHHETPSRAPLQMPSQDHHYAYHYNSICLLSKMHDFLNYAWRKNNKGNKTFFLKNINFLCWLECVTYYVGLLTDIDSSDFLCCLYLCQFFNQHKRS